MWNLAKDKSNGQSFERLRLTYIEQQCDVLLGCVGRLTNALYAREKHATNKDGDNALID